MIYFYAVLLDKIFSHVPFPLKTLAIIALHDSLSFVDFSESCLCVSSRKFRPQCHTRLLSEVHQFVYLKDYFLPAWFRCAGQMLVGAPDMLTCDRP